MPVSVAVEVLDLRLTEPGSRWLALAVVRVGPAEIRGVRMVRRDGRLKVHLPGVSLDKAVFLRLCSALDEAFREACEGDPWLDMRTGFPSTGVR